MESSYDSGIILGGTPRSDEANQASKANIFNIGSGMG